MLARFPNENHYIARHVRSNAGEVYYQLGIQQPVPPIHVFPAVCDYIYLAVWTCQG